MNVKIKCEDFISDRGMKYGGNVGIKGYNNTKKKCIV